MSTVERPPELQAILDEIKRAGPFDTLEDVNRLLARRTREYNAAPQTLLGGLSPGEMGQLLYGDWSSRGALRLNDALTFGELAQSALFVDARTLLDFVASEGPVNETNARNLPRSAVAKLLPRLRMPTQRRISVGIVEPPPLNEGDTFWLPVLRHSLIFAGLIMRRKGLRITPRGRELLPPERAGELFALLFLTVFRKLDLRVLTSDDRHAGLQSTVAYTFYKLRSAAREWRSSEALAEEAWLESAKDAPDEWRADNVDLRHYAFRHSVLDPLVQFGLLEDRVLPTEERWKQQIEFRLTPLFDRFMRFEFERAISAPFLMR